MTKGVTLKTMFLLLVLLTANFGIPSISIEAMSLKQKDKIQFIVIPDTQEISKQGSDKSLTYLQDYLSTLNSSSFDYILHVGDLVDDYEEIEEWESIHSVLQPYRNITEISPGNHDILQDNDPETLTYDYFDKYFGDYKINNLTSNLDLEVYPHFISKNMLDNSNYYLTENKFNLSVVLTHSFSKYDTLTSEGESLKPHLDRNVNYFVISGHYGVKDNPYFYRFGHLEHNIFVLGFNAQYDINQYHIALVTISTENIEVKIVDYANNHLLSHEILSYQPTIDIHTILENSRTNFNVVNSPSLIDQFLATWIIPFLLVMTSVLTFWFVKRVRKQGSI